VSPTPARYQIQGTRPEHFDGIVEVCRLVYPESPPWSPAQLASHLSVFPEGQFVAVETATGRVVGMAASLILLWDDYEAHQNWRDFTAGGTFRNHDPTGRTLYGAEVLVHPDVQRKGIGSRLYARRHALVRDLRLLRIRAGARLRGYHRVATRLTPEEYVLRVIRGSLRDPTLSFQLRHGYRVLGVVSEYLRHDPESLGYAALIEWINPAVAKPEDVRGRDPRFENPRRGPEPPFAPA
jgi:GNAT superfamily N-acetyltransferase